MNCLLLNFILKRSNSEPPVSQNLKQGIFQIFRIYWNYLVKVKFLLSRNTCSDSNFNQKFDYKFGTQGPSYNEFTGISNKIYWHFWSQQLVTLAHKPSFTVIAKKYWWSPRGRCNSVAIIYSPISKMFKKIKKYFLNGTLKVISKKVFSSLGSFCKRIKDANDFRKLWHQLRFLVLSTKTCNITFIKNGRLPDKSFLTVQNLAQKIVKNDT